MSEYKPEDLEKAAAELRQFPKWKSASEKLEAGAQAMRDLEHARKTAHKLFEEHMPMIERAKQAEARVKELEGALKPFAVFAERFRLKPMHGLDDVFYAIHSGEPEREAELRFSDCDKARAALKVKS